MTQYAQMPGSGLILPEDIARTQISAVLSNTFPAAHGAYRAASSRNKNTLAWSTSNGSADVDTLGDLQTLRQQSSDLIRNEALAAGAISVPVLGVVGPGIVPQARVDAEFLGLTAEEGEKFERAAERIFNFIANRQDFDISGRLNFWQAQRLVYRSSKERGDIGVMRRFVDRPGRPMAVSVQMVEADRIDTPSDKSSDDSIRAGVSFGADGAVEGYWVNQKHPGEGCYTTSSTDFTFIPARDTRGEPLMLQIGTMLRPGQTRGVPFLAPVVELFKQVGRYTEAEVSAAVTSAMLAIFVTSSAPVSPLTGNSVPGLVGGQQIVPKGNSLTRLQSGMIVDLAPGEDIKVATATRPNTAFEPFCDALLSYAGSALGIPRDVLTKRYNASYSAARAALQDAWRMYLVERDDLNAQFNQPVWNWVIDEAVARGLLSAPGYFDDPFKRAAYLTVSWVGPGMQSLDPLKDANAATVWHTLGVKSKQQISAENGDDFDGTLSRREKEKKAEDAAGLTPPPPAGTGAPMPGVQSKKKAGAEAIGDKINELIAQGDMTAAAADQLFDILEAV